MRLVTSLFFGLVAMSVVACDGASNGPRSNLLENPNFDSGLTAWRTTGSAKITTVTGIDPITRGAQITFDGTTSTTLSQEVAISQESYIGWDAFEATTQGAVLKRSAILNGNTLELSYYQGEDSLSEPMSNVPLGDVFAVQPGTLRLIWTMDSIASLNGSMQEPASTAGSVALITGVVLKYVSIDTSVTQ